MILVDANLLLYAENRADPNHERARDWWKAQLSGGETVGMAWVVIRPDRHRGSRLGLARVEVEPLPHDPRRDRPQLRRLDPPLSSTRRTAGGWRGRAFKPYPAIGYTR